MFKIQPSVADTTSFQIHGTAAIRPVFRKIVCGGSSMPRCIMSM